MMEIKQWNSLRLKLKREVESPNKRLNSQQPLAQIHIFD